MQDNLAELVKVATLIPPETDFDRFAAYSEQTGGITGADWDAIRAEDDVSRMIVRPEGGLTEEHYRRLGRTPWQRAELARAVLINLLRKRGHRIGAIEAAFRDIDEETLPALVEEHSFGTMADALETMLCNRRTPGETRQYGGNPVGSGHPGGGPSSDPRPAVPPIGGVGRGDSGPPNLEEIALRLKAVQAVVNEIRLKLVATGQTQLPPEYLSAQDAARFLGIEPSSLEHLRRSRKIRAIQVGDQRGFVYAVSDLRAFASQRTVKTASEALKELDQRRRRRR